MSLNLKTFSFLPPLSQHRLADEYGWGLWQVEKKKCSARSPDRRALLSAGQQSSQSKESTALPYTDTQTALVIFLVSGLVFVCPPPLAPSYQAVLLANYHRKGNRLNKHHHLQTAVVQSRLRTHVRKEGTGSCSTTVPMFQHRIGTNFEASTSHCNHTLCTSALLSNYVLIAHCTLPNWIVTHCHWNHVCFPRLWRIWL